MRITAAAPVIAAAVPATDPATPERRTISGMLVPYGPVGATSAGPITVRPGAIRLPSDLSRVKLMREIDRHERAVPVGHLVAAESRADGLYGTFVIGSTPDAQAALTEAVEHLRDGLSVELHNVTAGEPGEVAGADLSAALLCATPAFGDARVTDVAATLTTTPTDVSRETTPDAGTATPTQEAPQMDPQITPTAPPAPGVVATAPAAPAGLPAGPSPSLSAVQSMADVYATMSAFNTGQVNSEVMAALTDLTMSANIATQPPAYVGELWSGVQYQRRIVPLLSSGRLTSQKVTGWRWVTPPEVATWAGDKTDVPSNAATTEAVEATAQRLAGAHDIDRAFRDFGNTEFFASYYAAMTESYAKKSDAAAAAAVAAAAIASTVPAGSDFLDMIVAGALAMPEDDVPTFVLFSRDLLPQAFSLTRDTVPALLALSLGLDGTGQVDNIVLRAHSAVPAGTVIVGARQAMTFYELPGSPIRVSAVDLVKGGVDEGVFGYYATIANHAQALRKVTVAP